MQDDNKTNNPPKSAPSDGRSFSEGEKAAMRARAEELRQDESEGEKALLAKIAEMTEPDKSMATRLHTIIREAAPELAPKTWYGMPAYANKDGKAVCFFRCATKFKERYAQLGFNDMAKLDDGNMWPIAFALIKLTDLEEKKIAELVKKAAS